MDDLTYRPAAKKRQARGRRELAIQRFHGRTALEAEWARQARFSEWWRQKEGIAS